MTAAPEPCSPHSQLDSEPSQTERALGQLEGRVVPWAVLGRLAATTPAELLEAWVYRLIEYDGDTDAWLIRWVD